MGRGELMQQFSTRDLAKIARTIFQPKNAVSALGHLPQLAALLRLLLAEGQHGEGFQITAVRSHPTYAAVGSLAYTEPTASRYLNG
jgi:hypothetical protein